MFRMHAREALMRGKESLVAVAAHSISKVDAIRSWEGMCLFAAKVNIATNIDFGSRADAKWTKAQCIRFSVIIWSRLPLHLNLSWCSFCLLPPAAKKSIQQLEQPASNLEQTKFIIIKNLGHFPSIFKCPLNRYVIAWNSNIESLNFYKLHTCSKGLWGRDIILFQRVETWLFSWFS